MNIKHGLIGLFAIAAMQSSVAYAAPAVLVGSGSGQVGSVTPVQITVNWDGVPAVVGAQFDITYDNTQLTPDMTGACTSVNWGCSVFSPGTLRFVSSIVVSGIPDEQIGTIAFDISGAATDVYPLTVTNQQFGDIGEQAVTPVGTVNGQIEVLEGPQPSFSSVPSPGVINLGPVQQGAGAPTQNISISNNGEATSTLVGTCAMGAGDAQITLTSDGSYSVTQGAAADVQTVSCSTAAAGGYSRTLTCPHNGSNGPNAVFTVNCTVNPPPAPEFSSSNPAPGGNITLPATEQNDPNPSQTVNILNVGADATTLNGSCALIGPDSEIFLSGSGSFSVPKNGSNPVTVACDAAASPDSYSNTLRCTPTNASDNTPVDYPVSCTITEPGAAVFASSPAPGPIDVDNGNDVVVGDTDPTRVLTFFNNADAGDQNLDLTCDTSGAGDTEISASPTIAGGISIPPGGNFAVTFTCDTATSGNFTGTYNCNYQNGGVDLPAGDTPPPAPAAVYELSCEVREPAAEVEIIPAPGTPQDTSVSPGGSTSFEFDFTEINDEGLDGSLVGCELDSGGEGFSISSPTFPTDILSGSTVTVVVDFTDPTGGESWSDTLTCMFGDTDDDDTEVSWPLTVTIGGVGGDARFTVLKNFTDDNPGEVTVDLDCDTGLILDQEKTITEDGIGVTFVVTDFDSGELNCNVTERPVGGYSADYDSSGDSNNSSTDDPDTDAGCYYTTVNGGDENLCVITNSPLPVDVVITKEWLYPGSADASVVSDYFALRMQCYNAVIEGGYECGDFIAADGASSESYPDSYTCKNLSGYGDKVFTVEVTPSVYPGGSCYVLETSTDSAVEVDNGCAGVGQGLYSLEVSAGSGDSCTITNTVFFEGIPSLNQYGKILMALLMLGMGFIAVRRVI